MKFKYVVLGLTAISLLAAGCSKQTASVNSSATSNMQDTMTHNSTSSADTMMMASSTDDSKMDTSSSSDSMIKDNKTMKMTGSSTDEMMQK